MQRLWDWFGQEMLWQKSQRARENISPQAKSSSAEEDFLFCQIKCQWSQFLILLSDDTPQDCDRDTNDRYQ